MKNLRFLGKVQHKTAVKRGKPKECAYLSNGFQRWGILNTLYFSWVGSYIVSGDIMAKILRFSYEKLALGRLEEEIGFLQAGKHTVQVLLVLLERSAKDNDIINID